MVQTFKPALFLLLVFTLLTGLVYPVLVTVGSHALFPHQANGSLILRENQVIGSELIGQSFSGEGYFWSRPSATSPNPYNAGASTGSNLGPDNPALKEIVKARIEALKSADPGNQAKIPVDLVTASGSGLDPHISPAAADYQINRIAKARKIDPAKLQQLVLSFTEGRQWGILGEPRINVLKLNLALENAQIAVSSEINGRYSLPPSKINVSLCKKEALALHPGEVEKERVANRQGGYVVEYEIQARDDIEWFVLCDLKSGKIILQQIMNVPFSSQ